MTYFHDNIIDKKKEYISPSGTKFSLRCSEDEKNLIWICLGSSADAVDMGISSDILKEIFSEIVSEIGGINSYDIMRVERNRGDFDDIFWIEEYAFDLYLSRYFIREYCEKEIQQAISELKT